MQSDDPLTLVYKTCDSGPINLDVHYPTGISSSGGAVVYFHGGGLTVGNRKSWFPTWLRKRVNQAGHLLIIPDYRLLPVGGITGHEILQDIQDLFTFVLGPEFENALDKVCRSNEAQKTSFKLDPHGIAVSGTSAGGTCAYLAAIHAEPRPRAVLSMYGMGGDFLTSHYYTPKTTPFFRGRDLLNPLDFAQYLFPSVSSDPSKAISDSPLEYHPSTSPTPGYPANPHMLLSRLYLQLGSFLDYYTGQHNPSLSASLLEISSHNTEAGAKKLLGESIDDPHSALFPSLNVNSNWPPTLFVHGSEDSAVPVAESQHLHELLLAAGSSSELKVVEGKEHSFDYEPDAETMHQDLFDYIGRFLDTALKQ
ncbi:alpha/beta-hydrolase [Marasmius fiardii PR-910]|nr:alpha/beta-hydrolase [Marasmius fiardii PR-910]